MQGVFEKAPLVSIIVPVYNAEKTIDRCVSSILNQSYKDFELLLMNDGSTDRSGSLCDAYEERDSRVHVLHKENTGVSDTRNQGIAMARGEYLQFADSDDWLAPDAVAGFVRAATEHQCDMVIADFYRVIGERVAQKGDIEKDGVMDRTEYAVNMMQRPADFYYGVLWNKFYKRSIIEKHQIRMDSSVSWCEDFMFNMEYVRHARTIYAMKVPVYYYVKTKGSLVSQGISVKKTIQMKRTVFTHYNNFYKDVFDDEDYEKKKGQVYRFLFDAADDGSIVPHSCKLGEERTSVSAEAQEGAGLFFDLYRERKLQQRVFEIVALRNDLTMADVKVLYYLSQPHGNCTLKEMGDILNIPRREISAAIQRLAAKEMIVTSDQDKNKNKEKQSNGRRQKQQGNKSRVTAKDYTVSQETETILSEVMFALCDLEQIQYEGFSQEEIELYEKLNERRNRNIREALRY